MLTLTVPPAVEPVTLEQATKQCRVDIDDDNDFISALIIAARQKCESHLNRSFITTGWRFTLDGFPGQFSRFTPAAGYSGYGLSPLYGTVPEWALAGTGSPFVIPRARLIGVSSLSYLDQNGVRQTLDPSAYSVEAIDGGRVTPAYGSTWPPARVYPGSVVADVTLGYGPNPSDVPAVVTQAMLMIIGHLYENRDAVTDMENYEVPLGAKWLMAAEEWGCRP